MASYSELIEQINNLPIGNVYEKHINGKTYFYHQYFRNKKRYITIIPRENVDELIRKIKKRKELEKQLKKLSSLDKNIVLSDSARKLTGQVMCGNRPVAKFENGVLIESNYQLMPLIIERTN